MKRERSAISDTDPAIREDAAREICARLTRVANSLKALEAPQRGPLSDPRGVYLETLLAICELKAVIALMRVKRIV
jgi:hypothetical protein